MCNNAIPSENRLHTLIKCKITNIVKYSFESVEEHSDYLKDVHLLNEDMKVSFFQYSYGALLMVFSNGEEYSFGSAEDLNSVIVCLEKNRNGETGKNYIANDHEVMDITSISDISDHTAFSDLLNQPIVAVNILTTLDLNSRQEVLPSETGIEFVFENNRKLILSHNLIRNGCTFGVLTDKDVITAKTKVKYHFP